jgi:hypothetical protein
MKNNLVYIIIKVQILLILVFCSGNDSLSGQTENIGGIVNRYAKVSSIGAGYVIIGDLTQAAQFTSGDYVLLIQMQGIGIQTVQGSYGINVQAVFGTPGGYEFLIVQSVNTTTGRIDFTRTTYINSYNINGNIQLVKVPLYNSAVVTTALTGQTWSSTSGTGGVLAFFVSGRLTLNAGISVSGQGFSGALGVSGIGECVFTNESANNHDSYPLSWTNAGLKGEGVAIHDYSGTLLYPNHAKGQGRNFSGGGGGNGRYSGGGGGSNRGKGGDGGLEKYIPGQCGDDPRDGGYGGMNITGTVVQNGLFAGGGGGSSTQASGSAASAGGNGGGIVIIVADTIVGNNNPIISTGASATNAVSDAGAGGGGAGGSVALSFQTLNNQLAISSNGGNGGTNPGGFGQGGGGGGGLIWLSSSSLPSSVTGATVSGGTPAPSIPAEGTGEIRYNFVPALNGFLFNSIRAASNGTQTDSVCSNIMYGQITGTQPVGGTPPYTFQWQRSTTSATSGFTAAPGVNNQRNYTPPAYLTSTTWFRRVVTDNGAAVTDISIPVMIEVHQYIKNNTIGNPDTLCFGQNTQILHSLSALQDGNGIFSFKWESSTDNTNFASVPGTTENYQSTSGLTTTTWYRRTVNSGACTSISTSVRINVLPIIQNNTISPEPQEICAGAQFTNLTGSTTPTLSGGDNTYRFRWESSNDGSTWAAATGIINNTGYDPSETASYFPGQQYFRRVVLSGSNNVCVNASSSVLLSEYAVITNNSLSPDDQTICSGAVPLQLTGSSPLNGKGAGTYTYTWQDSTKTHTWTDISGFAGVTNQNYSPAALSDSTRYRRIVYSSSCVSTSRSVRVNVHKPVSGNTVSLISGGSADTTLCTGGFPNMLIGTVPSGGTNIPGDYAVQWLSSPDNVNWTEITGSGTGINYQPQQLSATTYFKRRVTSGQCSSESGLIKITILPVISNNTISADQTVCKNDTPELLTQASGLTLSGGSGTYTYLWEESIDGLVWNAASGTNNSSNGSYQPQIMTRNMKYHRIVKSGNNDCCVSTSNMIGLVLDSLPHDYVIDAGPDTIIFSFDNTFITNAGPAVSGGTGKWSVVAGSGSFQNDSDDRTNVNGLSKGVNKFMWTVTRGACKVEDLVEIIVNDLFIPEGFSPNDDPEGYNNTFEIKGLDLESQTADLVIINSSGTEVFSTTNRNGNEWKVWDGKNSRGHDLPEGTYYYLLKITSLRNSQVFRKSGFVILKRY